MLSASDIDDKLEETRNAIVDAVADIESRLQFRINDDPLDPSGPAIDDVEHEIRVIRETHLPRADRLVLAWHETGDATQAQKALNIYADVVDELQQYFTDLGFHDLGDDIRTFATEVGEAAGEFVADVVDTAKDAAVNAAKGAAKGFFGNLDFGSFVLLGLLGYAFYRVKLRGS